MSRGSARRGRGSSGSPPPGSRPGREGRADGNVRSPRHELKMALAVAESWTADFMRAAQPYPLPEVPAGSVGPAEEMAQVWVAEMEPAAVGVVKGTLPEAEATQPAAPAPVATKGG